MSIAEELREARKKKNLSQGGLAAALGTTQATVSQWENGKSVPKADMMAKLRELLGPLNGAADNEAKVDPAAGAEAQLGLPGLPSPAPTSTPREKLSTGPRVLKWPPKTRQLSK